jgi:hypothetical protein
MHTVNIFLFYLAISDISDLLFQVDNIFEAVSNSDLLVSALSALTEGGYEGRRIVQFS